MSGSKMVSTVRHQLLRKDAKDQSVKIVTDDVKDHGSQSSVIEEQCDMKTSEMIEQMSRNSVVLKKSYRAALVGA